MTVCLIIDDKDQERDFDSLVKTPLKKDGYDVKGLFIKTAIPEIQDDNQNLDKDKLIKHIKNVIGDSTVDLIATDFDLSDENLNGIDVVEIIRDLRPNTPLFMYSGKIGDAIKAVIGDHTKISNEELTDGVKKIIGYKILDFVNRPGYPSTIIHLVKSRSKSITSFFIEKLREYPDFEFKSCYPNFKGAKLGAIANQIEKSTYQGRDFQKELVEQTIAYLIEINKN
jgi:hypothetical protein